MVWGTCVEDRKCHGFHIHCGKEKITSSVKDMEIQ